MQSQCSIGFIGNIAVRLMFVLPIGILVSMHSAAVLTLFGQRDIYMYNFSDAILKLGLLAST